MKKDAKQLLKQLASVNYIATSGDVNGNQVLGDVIAFLGKVIATETGPTN